MWKKNHFCNLKRAKYSHIYFILSLQLSFWPFQNIINLKEWNLFLKHWEIYTFAFLITFCSFLPTTPPPPQPGSDAYEMIIIRKRSDFFCILFFSQHYYINILFDRLINIIIYYKNELKYSVKKKKRPKSRFEIWFK